MSIFKSSNPVLSESKFKSTVLEDVLVFDNENVMTVRGTMNKFGFLFLMTFGTAFYSWTEATKGTHAWTMVLVGVFGGIAVSLIMAFKKQWSPYLAPLGALLEGLFIGAVSAFFEYSYTSRQGGYAGGYSGIVFQAVALTFCVVIIMYLLYKFNVIKVTQQLRSVIIVATVSLGIFYLISWIISLSGGNAPSFIFQATPLGIGFSVFVVVLAALNLLLNFDIIEKGAEMRAPKYMEWYGAFGLLVTIVWLYLEILRLLSKINSRN